MSRLVDTHFHLDLHEDPEEEVRRIDEEGVYTIAVTTAPSFFGRTKAFTRGCTYIRPALGLHPELVEERATEVGEFLKLLPETSYVGEIGLDYSDSRSGQEEVQHRIFTKILEACSESGDKILTIHSRRAEGDVLAGLSDYCGQAILHWYSGGMETLRKALDLGCYFSINPAMVRSKRGRRVIEAVPKSRVLTESDGPFVSVDGRPASPTDVKAVLKVLASYWNSTTREAQRVVYENFEKITELYT